MNSTVMNFVGESLERVASAIVGVRLLLDNQNVPHDTARCVSVWALDTLGSEVCAAAETLLDHARQGQPKPEQSVPTLDPELMERNIQEAERVGQEVWEHFGRPRQ